ncbi:type II secretion system F family protein [Microbacterium nymphoidis]|uniref:type II secretion system F family protein n=1 Tax=Microbacterium nymphoidis TaxID=2898586 RepID=UPI001E2C9727|nr:type II secretion system F family protein [Microbacterium nymphoidis]MCD2496982.1 type II secretion system F family protein [Microbacterium nymphoidis]
MTAALTDGAIAVLLGTVLGSGLWSILAALPRWSAPQLVRRIAPYVRDITDPAGTSLPAPALIDPAAGLTALVRVGWRVFRRRLVPLLGGTTVLATRLRRAGWKADAERFRERQLALAVGAAALGALVTIGLALTGRFTIPSLLLPIVFGVAGFFGTDVWLTQAVNRRRQRIEDELPTVLDFLALCLAAGESLHDAVKRTASVGVGALAGELRAVTVETGTGSNLATALAAAGERIGVPGVSRAFDHLLSALERGAPLAAVLRDQATDAREDRKQGMLDQAGRKEVTMLFPLVFLILPLSVLLAVFPGIHLLRLG